MSNTNATESLVLQLQQHIKELEHKISEQQKEIKEIFTGILATSGSILTELIPKIDNNNSAK